MAVTPEPSSCPACGNELASDAAIHGLCPQCLLGLALEPAVVEPTQGQELTDLPSLDSPKPPLTPGETLGNRYQIRELLGRGGMGEVWRAFDVKLQVEVALKTLRQEFLADERWCELLRREVRSAREVVSPNVCRLFDLVTAEDQELVSMEYIDGTTLLEILKSRGPLELSEASEIAAQFLAGLEAIHHVGLVHRDVKPENIMVTRAGRIVVMDLGIAQGPTNLGTSTIAGTPAYMAPEQARGGAIDARTDVYSAGVVLAEMISSDGLGDAKRRGGLWRALRQDPTELPESPWKHVLVRALAWQPEDRYPSSKALARALEEITVRVGAIGERSPYPGLARFTEADAEYFFGRELEVEALWKKLQRPHLLALIGASGAGKSSFLSAGLIPAKPEGWSCVLCAPGDRPFTSLAQALVPEFASEPEVMHDLLRLEEPDVAVSIARRWRQRHGEVLAIIDQFEELFTLNPEGIQTDFAELLGRLALDADVHVVLSMRDDFLLHCHRHEALRPIFSEITPLAPPTGDALRRALIQPALLCGYRYEDDELVDDMLAEIADERGALPLLAFAAAAVWQRRDRERGLLTRQAFERIGGVAGALAQHAEETLARIGSPRLPIVRELFRNLATAQGTRAVRNVNELLSVFEEQDTAADVLRHLIDARLLISFDIAADGEESVAGRRVEIIHESLLEAWPRLVRWRTQDADQARLRDQLRQVAQVWDERGRPADLLWTGTSFREFSLWREHYPGGLTATEEAYAQGMESHARRRQRRRRLGVAVTIALLLGVVTVISGLWIDSRRSERRAIAQTRRAEASKLFALGQLELEQHPTAALAYATKSLDLADSHEGRALALDALWRGPTAFVLGTEGGRSPARAEFSPDGQWLLLSNNSGQPILWRNDGSAPRLLERHAVGFDQGGGFSSDSRWLVTTGAKTTRIWSLPSVEKAWQLDKERDDLWHAAYRDRLLAWNRLESKEGARRRLVRTWPLAGGEAASRGVVVLPRGSPAIEQLRIDPVLERIVYAAGGNLYELPLGLENDATPRLVHQDSDPIHRFHLAAPTNGLVTEHASGRLTVWQRSSDGDSFESVRTLAGDPDKLSRSLDIDPDGRWLAVANRSEQTVELLDLAAPTSTAPLILHRGEVSGFVNAVLHPSGEWLATSDVYALSIWPLSRPYPRVIGTSKDAFRTLAFDPAGEWLAATSGDSRGGGGRLWVWPLSPTGEPGGPVFDNQCGLFGLDVSPGGDLLVVGSSCGEVFVLPPSGQPVRRLGSFGGGPIGGVAFGPQGLRVAAGGHVGEPVVRIWNLDTDEVQDLDSGRAEPLTSIAFTADGGVLAARMIGGLRLWDLEDGTFELLVEGSVIFALSKDRRYIVGVRSENAATPGGEAFVYDLEQRTSWQLATHGDRVSRPGWHPGGGVVVTPSRDGTIRVGPMTGEEPHLLLGHQEMVWDVKVDPGGRWIASAGEDGTVRLWPIPTGEPLHTLPHDELMARLYSLTNYRAIADEEAVNGYRLDVEPFEGWDREPPSW